MKVGETTNGFGVAVSLHRCCYCGDNFSVTPARDDAWGLGCLMEGCPSYDVSRDADLFWDVDPHIAATQS
jgi:hypothetical protein